TRMRLKAPQFVQLGRIAVCDHAAVAQHRSRLARDGFLQQLQTLPGSLEVFLQFLQKLSLREKCPQLSKQPQAVPQSGEVARPRILERYARCYPLDIREFSQNGLNFRPRSLESLDCIVSSSQCLVVPQGMVKPVAQQPAAHAGRALI